MIDRKRCCPLVNARLTAEIGSPVLQRGELRSAQFWFHASLNVLKEQKKLLDVEAYLFRWVILLRFERTQKKTTNMQLFSLT